MRIALFTDGIFPYVIGGMQKHSFYLAKYLAQNKVSIDLYHFNKSTYNAGKMELFSDEEKKFISPVLLDFPGENTFPGHYIRASYRYSELIFSEFRKRSKVDFVYAKGFSAWKLLEEKSKCNQEIPPVGVNFHGYEMFQSSPDFLSGIKKYFFRTPVKHNIKLADYVFSYGGGVSKIIHNLGIENRKIIEVPAAIEKKYLTDTSCIVAGSRLKFIYVGRFEPRKGIKELNRAILLIKRKHDIEFSFVGPMPEEYEIIDPQIHYYGVIQDQDILFRILREHDILVCPSYAEGMPNVIIEAMACGLAVLATDVGAVDLLVDENNGWLIEQPSPRLIEAALLSAINSDSKSIMRKKKNSVRKIIDNFTQEKVFESFLNILQGIIKQ